MEFQQIIKFNTVKEFLQFNAARYETQNAFALKKNKDIIYWTYGELQEKINCIGTALLSRKLAGKNIAVIGKNSCEWCLAYLSVICGAGVVVPIDKELDGDTILEMLKFASVKAVFADVKTVKKLKEAKKHLPRKLMIFLLDEEESEEFVTLDGLVAEGKELIKNNFEDYFKSKPEPDDTAVIMFTSGTTAAPKAVMLSNKNICSDIFSVSSCVAITDEDSTHCVLPLHHAYQSIVFLTVLYNGGTVSCCESLRHVSKNLQLFKPTVFVTVPLMLEKMHKKILEQLSKQSGIKRYLTTGKVSHFLNRFDFGDLKKHIYSIIHDAFGGSLRMIIVGAAPLKSEVAADFESFGIPVVIGYGLTECSPIAICNSLEERTVDSLGKPIDGAHVILDSLDENGIGEICINGPMVMKGYYKNKKATNEVIKNGWLKTGDLGYCDSNGNYHITGRLKNVIVTKGGKNVYPEEIEYYLNSDPMVLESLIFGDENDGDEEVVANVVPDEEAIKEKLHKEKLSVEDIQRSISEVVRKINRRLPSYKNIKKINIGKEELEKNRLQKIIRNSGKEKNPSEAEVDTQHEHTDDESQNSGPS